jgi:hypothetical protein
VGVINNIAMLVNFLVKSWQLKATSKDFLELSDIDIKNGKMYILGTGGSAGLLSSKQFENIRSGFSVGVNFWTIHNFIPDAYALEPPEHPSSFKILLSSLVKNIDNTSPLIMLYSGKCPSFQALKNVKNYTYIRPIANEINNYHEMGRYIKFLKNLNHPGMLSIGYGSTIERVLSMGIIKGFDEIIFVGVDLNNSKYFWDVDKRYYKHASKIVTEDSKKRSHLTLVDKSRTCGLIESISTMSEIASKNFNIKISVENPKSELAKVLTVYRWP